MPHRYPKKPAHALPSVESVTALNRSTSSPNILISSSPSVPQTTKAKTNDKQKPLKTVRTWFKLLSIHQFIRRKHKNPPRNKKSKSKNLTVDQNANGLRRFSELLF